MKKHLLTILSLLIASSLAVGCSDKTSEKKVAALVPQPNAVSIHSGTFNVAGQPFALADQLDVRTINAVNEFAAQLTLTTGRESRVSLTESMPSSGFRFVTDSAIAEEGYKLLVTKNGAEIHASQFAGFFYAIQTIKELLPAAIYGNTTAADADWTLPCLTIEDAPRFAYRGMSFDVSRHFFDLDEVKRYIDIMAVHKLNTLHWHLTDDQGWRIEIKKYPLLTEVGGTRKGTMIKKEWGSNDGIPHGGFYTQEQIREVVEYAAAHAITVIPEIDLPGHMLAALTAYPQLGCTGGPYQVWDRWGVADDVLCIGKEKTFEFIEDVLTEVMELFPSKYIHIGGDECPKVRWEKCPHCQARIKALGLKGDDKFSAEQYLQSYVTKRVEKFLADHGRRVIGWDEILEGEISPTAVIMSWRGSSGGIEGARKGHEVVMTPNSHFYFDYYQALDTDNEPFGIGGYVPVEKVYSFDPYDQLTEEQQQYILGVQANMWTEYIAENWHLEYMILPRMAALCEVQWCNEGVRDYDRFLANFRMHEIYDQMGYTYAKHIFGVQGHTEVTTNGITVELTTSGDAPIYYTLDGSQPTEKSTLYTKPVQIKEECILKASSPRSGVEVPVYTRDFSFTKTTGHTVVLNSQPTPKYHFNAPHAFTDGHHGSARYSDTEWVGYENEPMDITIDMSGSDIYSSVTIEAFVDKPDWIFPPRRVEVSGSEDGINFTTLGILAIPEAAKNDSDGIKYYTLDFDQTNMPYLRVLVETTSSIPDWHGAKGKKAHMFIGEISAE